MTVTLAAPLTSKKKQSVFMGVFCTPADRPMPRAVPGFQLPALFPPPALGERGHRRFARRLIDPISSRLAQLGRAVKKKPRPKTGAQWTIRRKISLTVLSLLRNGIPFYPIGGTRLPERHSPISYSPVRKYLQARPGSQHTTAPPMEAT